MGEVGRCEDKKVIAKASARPVEFRVWVCRGESVNAVLVYTPNDGKDFEENKRL